MEDDLIDDDGLIVGVRDTSVLEPVLDTLLVLLCVPDAETVVDTRLLVLARTVVEGKAELVLVLLDRKEDESDGEAVLVLETDLEPVSVLE